ncbi:MAG: DUF3800 domain-containing protein [Sphingomonadales bacterium]|nr:DUF3800 domain-containing protein [Sphingomonadales bacterium]
MTIYCDESGGVGRGVMTLAALSLKTDDAASVLHAIRRATGISGELKGSRIDLETRAFVFDQLDAVRWDCCVSIAISATTPDQGVDRGEHDVNVYSALLEAAILPLVPPGGQCAEVVIDDGRYSDQVLGHIRRDIAEMIGPCGLASLADSHRSPGLQLADVIANSFFNRALPSDRQSVIAAIVQPRMDAGRIRMQVIGADEVEDA